MFRGRGGISRKDDSISRMLHAGKKSLKIEMMLNVFFIYPSPDDSPNSYISENYCYDLPRDTHWMFRYIDRI